MEGGIDESFQDSLSSSVTQHSTPFFSCSAEDDDDLSHPFWNLSIGSSFDMAEGANLLRRHDDNRTPSHVGNSPYLLSSTRSLFLQESVPTEEGERGPGEDKIIQKFVSLIKLAKTVQEKHKNCRIHKECCELAKQVDELVKGLHFAGNLAASHKVVLYDRFLNDIIHWDCISDALGQSLQIHSTECSRKYKLPWEKININKQIRQHIINTRPCYRELLTHVVKLVLLYSIDVVRNMGPHQSTRNLGYVDYELTSTILARLTRKTDNDILMWTRKCAVSLLISQLKMDLSAQLQATTTLTELSVYEEGKDTILDDDDAIPTIVDLLINSTLKLKIKVAFLVESMASRCTKDQYSRCVKFVGPLMASLLRCVSEENHDNSNNAGVPIQELGVVCAHTIYLLSEDCFISLHIVEEDEIQLLTKVVRFLRGNNDLREDKLLIWSEEILKRIIGSFLCYQHCVESNGCPFKLIRTNHPAINSINERLIQHVVQDVELPSWLRTGAISVVESLSGVLPLEDLQGLVSPLVGQLNDKNLNVAKEALTVLLSFVKRDELLKYHVCLAILEVHGIVILEGWLKLHPHELASNGYLLLKALAGEFERKRLPELYYSSNGLQFQIFNAIKEFEKAENSVLVFDEYEEEYYISEEDESSDDNVDEDKQKDDSILEENVETI